MEELMQTSLQTLREGEVVRGTVVAVTSDEVVDIFQRGQGVFGIAVGPVQQELVGEIHRLIPDDEVVVISEEPPSKATAT